MQNYFSRDGTYPKVNTRENLLPDSPLCNRVNVKS